MSLIPWRPFRELENFFEEWPELSWTPEKRVPRMDVYEDEKNVVAEVELPGVKPEDVNVEIKDNILSIEAKKKQEEEERGKDYYRRELSSGYYRRALRLPSEVQSDKADAEYKDGMLKVVIPKVKPSKPEATKIKVKGK